MAGQLWTRTHSIGCLLLQASRTFLISTLWLESEPPMTRWQPMQVSMLGIPGSLDSATE